MTQRYMNPQEFNTYMKQIEEQVKPLWWSAKQTK